MGEEEFAVESNFEFKSIISGDMHGVAIWFDAEFDTDDVPITLKTGPEDLETHWCQTLLRMTEPISVCQDDSISGSITITKNKEVPRSLDICLSFVSPTKITKHFSFD